MTALWGSIDIDTWRNTPCIVGRSATEKDVEAGHAVFYVDGDSQAASGGLPKAAYLLNGGEAEIPVVVIQVEQTQEGIAVGFRPLSGGNGVCMFEELEFVDDFHT